MTRRAARLWLLVAVFVVLPLTLVAAVAYSIVDGEEPSTLSVAPGASGGVFHPVAGSFVADETTIDSCAGETDYTCLQQGFGNVAYRRGAKAALTLFDAQMRSDKRVRADCHRIAHVIGSAAFALYDGNVARTFAEGSATCASGYYHGILERAFVGVTTRSELVEAARSLCRANGIRRRGFLDYQCQHGLGHGLMIQTGYDLPIALSTCRSLETRWDDVVCAGGVFMENVTTRFGFRSPWLDDEDPLAPCAEIAAHHRRSCYLRAPVRVLEHYDGNFARAAQTCATLEPAEATACYRGLGREAVSTANYATARIVALCAAARTAQGQCLFGAARTIGDGFGLTGARRAARMCAGVPGKHRESCYAGLGIVVGLLHATNAARRAACAKLAGAHAAACSAAAIAEVLPDGRAAWG